MHIEIEMTDLLPKELCCCASNV